MTTLPGCSMPWMAHGFHFTYLPVVFQDDCQVCKAATHFRVNSIAEYLLEVEFLD
jgi:hypothetical protein